MSPRESVCMNVKPCFLQDKKNIQPQDYKTFFMLNLSEHEIFSANKYESAKKEFAIVSILRSISMKNFMLI